MTNLKENYNITVEQAKQMKDKYKFSDGGFKTKEEILELLNTMENQGREDIMDLYFGYLNIEVDLEKDSSYKNGYCISYFINIKDNNGDWFEYDYADDGKVEENIDNIEQHMFKCLMHSAEENSLYWSQPNDD